MVFQQKGAAVGHRCYALNNNALSGGECLQQVAMFTKASMSISNPCCHIGI